MLDITEVTFVSQYICYQYLPSVLVELSVLLAYMKAITEVKVESEDVLKNLIIQKSIIRILKNA